MTVTPKALAGYAKNLYELDTKGKYATNKYKLEVRLPKGDDDVEKFRKMVLKAHKDAGNNEYKPVKDGDVIAKETDNDKRAAFAKDHWVMTFKTAQKPAVVDSKKKKLPKGVEIMGGDTIKVSFNMSPYDMSGGGISLQLNGVMLLEKAGGRGGSADEFEEEDGFVAEDDDDAGVEDDEDDDDF